MKKQAGMLSQSEELRERFHLMLNTRLENDLEFRDLFTDAYKTMKAGDQSKMKKLFAQHAAVITQAPNLAIEIPDPPREDVDPFAPGQPSSTGTTVGGKLTSTSTSPPKQKKLALKKTASVAPHVDEWFEKNAHLFLSEAQQRFPELLKVAADTKTVPTSSSSTAKVKGSGKVPTQSSLSGGSA